MICPYCGKEIQKEEILFYDDTFTTAKFEDEIRYAFLTKFQSFSLKEGNAFPGCYFLPSDGEVTAKDENGFPTMVRVRPCDGKTPMELLKGEEATDIKDKSKGEDPIVLMNRACPHCHCKLPLKYGETPVWHICMFGGRAAGKTAYLAALLQQLSTQLQECNLGSVAVTGESKVYFDAIIRDFEEGQLAGTVATTRLLPLVLQYTAQDGKLCYFVIYDIAGEGIVKTNGEVDPTYLLNYDGLKKSDTLLLVLDPNMVTGGGLYLAAQDANSAELALNQTGEVQHDYCELSLTTFLSQVSQLKEQLSGIRYVVAISSKMDQVLLDDVQKQLFMSPRCEVKRDNVTTAHKDGVNRETIRTVTEEVSGFYNHNLPGDNADVRKAIKGTFGQQVEVVDMLGVSIYTLNEGDDRTSIKPDKSLHKTARKHRIIEPFLDILYLHGLARKSAQAIVQSPPQEPPRPPKRKKFLGLF